MHARLRCVNPAPALTTHATHLREESGADALAEGALAHVLVLVPRQGAPDELHCRHGRGNEGHLCVCVCVFVVDVCVGIVVAVRKWR
jgi:hypothetical protein